MFGLRGSDILFVDMVSPRSRLFRCGNCSFRHGNGVIFTVTPAAPVLLFVTAGARTPVVEKQNQKKPKNTYWEKEVGKETRNLEEAFSIPGPKRPKF